MITVEKDLTNFHFQNVYILRGLEVFYLRSAKCIYIQGNSLFLLAFHIFLDLVAFFRKFVTLSVPVG